ncbi:hypothetical protein L4C36_03360 [Photobacterium japonica]|uniref:hypothetical protein n=1 Tax=Photobacterium japonica TaxID=2910235 RepID=UPI003D112D04
MPIPQYMKDNIVNQNNDVNADENIRTMFSDQDRLLKRLGNANWRALRALNMQFDDMPTAECFYQAASGWKKALEGVEYPWLVWSVDEDWAYVQQKMVVEAGWTPIVGYDPRAKPPTKLLKESILVDFNQGLNLPIFYMHIPLDFIHLFAPRLAFFHSDLLVKPEKMAKLSALFKALPDGEIAMTNLTKLRFEWMQKLFSKQEKLFELAGCITRGASQDIFDKGCSMWQGWAFHPNCPSEEEFQRRLKLHWDHGAGLLYWQQHYGGKVTIIQERYLDEGHFSRTSKDNFKVLSDNNENRDTGLDLRGNYDVYRLAKQMGISC